MLGRVATLLFFGSLILFALTLAVFMGIATIDLIIGSFTRLPDWLSPHFSRVDSAESHLTVFRLGLDVTAFAAVTMVLAGLIFGSSRLLDVLMLSTRRFERFTRERLRRRDLYFGTLNQNLAGLLFLLITLGGGGSCAYYTSVSQELTIDRRAESVTLERDYLFRSESRVDIPLEDITRVSYRCQPETSTDSQAPDVPESSLAIAVVGRGNIDITSSLPIHVLPIASALANAAELRLSKSGC